MLKPLLKLVSCRKRSNVVSEKKDTINQEKRCLKGFIERLIVGKGMLKI